MRKIYLVFILFTILNISLAHNKPTIKDSLSHQSSSDNNYKISVLTSIKGDGNSSLQKNSNNVTIGKNDTTNLEAALKIGFILNNNFTVGCGMGYYRGWSKDITTTGNGHIILIRTIIKPIIFARLYPFEKNRFFIEMYFTGFGTKFSGFGESLEKINDNTVTSSKNKLRMFEAGVTPGYEFFSLKIIPLHFEVKYGWIGYTSLKTISTIGTQEKNRADEFKFSFKPDTFIFGISFNFIKK